MDIKQKRAVLHEMKKLFYHKGAKYLDWMGYPITESNCPSYHHIEKAEDLRNDGLSDEATLENGAYLGKKSHEKLHLMEMIDHDLYLCWNDLFLLINKMGIYPIDDVWETVYLLQKRTEENIIEYKKSKQGVFFSKKSK